MTSSNGQVFRVTDHLSKELNSTHKGQWRGTLMSKQSGGWWFETPLRPLWRHRNVIVWWFLLSPYTLSTDDMCALAFTVNNMGKWNLLLHAQATVPHWCSNKHGRPLIQTSLLLIQRSILLKLLSKHLCLRFTFTAYHFSDSILSRFV